MLVRVLPARDNAANDCEALPRREQDPDLPDHIVECSCVEHTGFCLECNYKITIGPSLIEYGHARARNRDASDRAQGDCPHRPKEAVDPQRGSAQRAQIDPRAAGLLTALVGGAIALLGAASSGVIVG